MPPEDVGWKNVRIPEDVWEAAKNRSTAARTTIQEVVEKALREYLGLPEAERHD